MRIGELARRADCPVDTVRYYEKERLLPAPRRSGANYREYGLGHLARLVGFSIQCWVRVAAGKAKCRGRPRFLHDARTVTCHCYEHRDRGQHGDLCLHFPVVVMQVGHHETGE